MHYLFSFSKQVDVVVTIDCLSNNIHFPQILPSHNFLTYPPLHTVTRENVTPSPTSGDISWLTEINHDNPIPLVMTG